MARAGKDSQAFWTTLPGILTATAALITALVAGYTTIHQTSTNTHQHPPANTQTNLDSGNNQNTNNDNTTTGENKAVQTKDNHNSPSKPTQRDSNTSAHNPNNNAVIADKNRNVHRLVYISIDGVSIDSGTYNKFQAKIVVNTDNVFNYPDSSTGVVWSTPSNSLPHRPYPLPDNASEYAVHFELKLKDNSEHVIQATSQGLDIIQLEQIPIAKDYSVFFFDANTGTRTARKVAHITYRVSYTP